MSVEVTRLPSGLTVVTDSMPHLETASLGVWVGSGSRDERPDEHGISHLLEHMAFKGTKRRSARQIAEEIEAVGGDLNAATSVETTAYYARVLQEPTCRSRSTCCPTSCRTRPSIRTSSSASRTSSCRRSARPRTRPTTSCSTICRRARFPNQPIGRSILGTPRDACARSDRNAARLSRAQLSRARHGGGGGRRGRSRGGGRPRSSSGSASFTGRRRRRRSRRSFGGGAKLEARDLEQVHIALALEGLPQRDPELFSLQVFAIVLGGGMSSRLFQEVREKRGLCYAIYAFHAPYSDTGMFGIYAGTDAADVKELMRVVVDEIAAAAERITEAEVARAKAQMKAGLLMALESSGARAEQLARQILVYGRPVPLEEMVARIDARHGRKRPRRRPRADRARPAGDRGARTRHGA